MKALVFTAPGTGGAARRPRARSGPRRGSCRGPRGRDLRKRAARRPPPGFRQPPLIMGHEFAGIAGGEAVVVNPILSCGRCPECRRGLRHVCREREIIGVHRGRRFRRARRRARDGAPPAAAGTAVGGGGADRARRQRRPCLEPGLPAARHQRGSWHRRGLWRRGAVGARVAVIGCGAIGLLCAATALSGGAARVEVTDLSPARLAAAQRLGAQVAGPACPASTTW